MEYRHYSRDNLTDVLRAHGINPTYQRIEIAHVLYSREEHLSADRVLALVNERNPETSRATVYNALNLFVEKKMIRKVIVDRSRAFYCPNTSTRCHIYDIGTGGLTDIDEANMRIEGLPKLTPGTVSEGVDVIIRVRKSVKT